MIYKSFETKFIKLLKRPSSKRYEKYCHAYSQQFNISSDTLFCICCIERICRPYYQRCVEYFFTVIGIILNLIFRIPLKNYTVGCCQIGLANILRYNGFSFYGHLDKIYKFRPNMVIPVLKAFSPRWSIKICAFLIEDYSNKFKATSISNYNKQLGFRYNGTIEYGILLNNLYQKYIAYKKEKETH